MRTCLAVIALIALSGCVPPTVTASGGDKIAVWFDPLVDGPEERQRAADEECARGGRAAKFVEIERQAVYVEHSAIYECVPKP